MALKALLAPVIILILASSCDDESGSFCDSPDAIQYESGVCVEFSDPEPLEDHMDDILSAVENALELIRATLPLNNLRILIHSSADGAIPEIGMGGYNPSADEVIIWIDPDFLDLQNSIEFELGPQITHETHHAMRRRAIGYGSTLLQAAVSEGLADWYSIEVYGIDPPLWSVNLTGDTLHVWIDEASKSWHEPYDHSDWFVGTSPDIPRWAGYSIGYELVRLYLEEHPEESASTLVGEPASSFEL